MQPLGSPGRHVLCGAERKEGRAVTGASLLREGGRGARAVVSDRRAQTVGEGDAR